MDGMSDIRNEIEQRLGVFARPGAKAAMAKTPIRVTDAEYAALAARDAVSQKILGDSQYQITPSDRAIRAAGDAAYKTALARHSAWDKAWRDAPNDAARAEVEERAKASEAGMRVYRGSRPGAKSTFGADAGAVAKEILRQLGGGRFMSMVGGKNAFHGNFGGKPGLQVDIGKGAQGGINRLIVTLDPASDTYNMEFWRIAKGGLSTKKVSEASGVYADDLQRVFTDRTKFYTSMSRPGAKSTHALSDACWEGYEAVGMKQKDSRTVPNCVPKATAAKPDDKTECADCETEQDKAGLKLMEKADKAVSDKIRTLIKEGKPQDQAVAIALDMKRRGEL